MPRQPRLVIPHFPHHVIQRGHNRQVVFAADDDYLFYLDTLQEWKARLGCRIYAYCLMTNHKKKDTRKRDGKLNNHLLKQVGFEIAD